MSRSVATRFKIAGTLIAETPIHVGGIEGNPATDMPLSVDGQGKPYVPGTSLAGPFRHWLIERFGLERVEPFWGRIPGRIDEQGGHASYVLIENGEITLPRDAPVEIRDGVGIDRAYGTAADGIKFDREVLPKGTKIQLDMTLDCVEDADGRGEMRALLEALGRSEIRLGAAKTRGLGKVRLQEVTVAQFDIDKLDGVLALLKARGTVPADKKKLDALGPEAEPASGHARIRIRIDWTPSGPVMVKASADGTAVDMMPLVTANGAGEEALVIPGSSVKGALRQQSERILATLLQCPVADAEPGQQRFIGQLTRLALVETLYGAVKKRKEGSPEAPKVENGAKRPGRGALSADDCLAVRSLPRAEWQEIADAALVKDTATAEEKAQSVEVRTRAAANGVHVATHVAIDRWTGGAADGALFTAAEPRLEWEPICIEIDPTRLVPSDREDKEKAADREIVAKAAIALLLLTLRDLAAGLVPLGFGVNRGYGDVKVRRVTLTVEGAPKEPWIAALGGLQLTNQNGCIEIGPKDKLAPLAKAWTDYLAAHCSAAGESAEAHP